MVATCYCLTGYVKILGKAMLNEEGSVESTRRELTAMLFGSIKQGDEIEYGLNKVLVSLSAGSLLFSMTFISALAPGRHWLGCA